MKHVIPLNSAFVNSFTDSEELQEMIPDKMTPYLLAAAEEREQQQEIETLNRLRTRHGAIKRIATNIPMPILAAIQQLDPDFGRGRGIGRDKFFRWLKEHPEWDAIGKVGK